MEAAAREFFKRYEDSFNRSYRGDVDPDEYTSTFASDLIVASPSGVTTKKTEINSRMR